MKKFICLTLTVCMLIGLCACDTAGVSSEITSSEDVADISSVEATSSEDLTPLLWREIDGKKYYDIDIANRITPTDRDSSALFIEEADGYYIESEIYYVDADTMFRVLEKPFKGNGAIKWTGYSETDNNDGYHDFDGILYISKMDDPIYKSTCLPNERSSYMQTHSNRIHASIHNAPDNEVSCLPIGAIYLNDELTLPDDAELTLCLGRMTCAVKLKGEDEWKIVSDRRSPDAPKSIYYLPWELQSELGVYKIDNKNIKIVNGHCEVKLKGKDLNGGNLDDDRIVGSCLHFWGDYYRFEDSSQIEGVLTSLEVWVKEPEYAKYLTASVAADWRNAEKRISQVFCSINYAVTTEPRVIIGHNVPSKLYDELMDSEQVQKLIGMK